MPAAFWVGLVCGVAVGGLVGFFVAHIVKGSGSIEAVAAKKIAEADARAEHEHERIDSELNKILIETPGLSGKELEDAINRDFDDRPGRLPVGHPQLRRPSSKPK